MISELAKSVLACDTVATHRQQAAWEADVPPAVANLTSFH